MKKRFTIKFGAGVDQFLASQCAIAQAVDGETIFATSSLWRIDPRERMLILLHELAHLEQLATPGCDPVPYLEQEAWEAAHAWIARRPYRIRGRGRAPLNAIAMMKDGMHPVAPQWYKLSPVEPIGPAASITVKDFRVLRQISIEAIFDQILASKESEYVVINHGTQEGLAIPITNASKEQDIVALASLRFLALDAPGTEETDFGPIKLPRKSDKEVADIAKISESQVTALRKKMNDVRSLKLKHIAFRACQMGSETDTMQVYQKLFGAVSISAPAEYDAFGEFIPDISGGVDSWAEQKRKVGWLVSIEDGVAIGTKTQGDSRRFQIGVKAAEPTVFSEWLRTHVRDGAWNGGSVVFHGMKIGNQSDWKAPNIYFVRDPRFKALLRTYPTP